MQSRFPSSLSKARLPNIPITSTPWKLGGRSVERGASYRASCSAPIKQFEGKPTWALTNFERKSTWAPIDLNARIGLGTNQLWASMSLSVNPLEGQLTWAYQSTSAYQSNWERQSALSVNQLERTNQLERANQLEGRQCWRDECQRGREREGGYKI